MFARDKYIRFQGFKPSDFTQTFLHEKIGTLHEEAPYGSTFNAVFTRKGRLIKGVITIYSSVGRFFAVASGYRLREVANKLTDRMRRQLNRWKSRRFAGELDMNSGQHKLNLGNESKEV